MYWFKLKTKYGWVKIMHEGQIIYEISLTNKIQKNDKYYKIYPELQKDLKKYFRGVRTDFNKYKVKYGILSDFAKRVLKNTQLIPYGIKRSYCQIAEKSGKPKSYRAVGNVLKKNPVPIIIPCHRVIQKNGETGGFSAGIKWKTILLHLEDKY